MRPVLSKFNGFFKRFTRAVLFYQTFVRVARRLPRGGVEPPPPSRAGALMIALQERASGEIVAVADLSEQPRDGKVPGDLRLPRAPWGSDAPPARVAYVCNLAVLSSWRGRGLGTALLRSCETIARERWGRREVYLHAATAQERLLDMYGKQGYEALPSFDQPQWVLALAGREQTRYHVKQLDGSGAATAPGAGSAEGGAATSP